MGLDIGTRLGPYEIAGLIGAGGMGEVYRARDTRLDRTVAIKVLPSALSSDPERRARFEREAKTISGLSHPNICSLYDVGEHAGRAGGSAFFLVMEHLEGETLAERLRRGAFPVSQTLACGAQIADALDAAHKHGIVHRDLKPGNVMLTRTGAKLLDFGLAKLTGRAAQAGVLGLSSMTGAEPSTGTGTIAGTLPYMAPEQLEGKPADGRTDLWALGTVLYEMLTGARAFAGDSAASVVGAILAQEPAPPGALRPQTPPALARLIARCLAKDPDERWDSAHDVADELRWIAQSLDSGAVAPGAAVPLQLRTRRWGAAGVAALAVAALAVVAGIGAAWRWGSWKPSAGGGARPAITSIAVLPLENLSGDTSQEYFADGLTDSLINELAQIRALRVISRTSVMRYKGARKPIREIAHELNDVGAIVEGTVMRDAGRVAVSVQLIDAATDAHLWSQAYERDLTDVLALRKEIAASVAREIQAAIEPAEERRLARRETVNPEAFERYLRALEILRRGDTAANLRASRSAMREAVQLDPRLPEAHVQLAEVNARLWWYHWDRTPERVHEARAAAERALELDPDLPAAHRARGSIHYFLELDYERALAEYSAALEHSPSDSTALAQVAYVKRRQGLPRETVLYLERSRALDPLNATVAFNLGETHALLRQPDAAERCYNDALRLSPTYNRPFAYRLRWRLRLRPGLQQAQDVEREAESAGLGGDPIVLYHRVLLHVAAGEDRKALALLDGVRGSSFEDQFWFVPAALLEAQVRQRQGQRAAARERYAEARRIAEAQLASNPEDSRAHSALGLALAGLGDNAAAIRAGQAGVDALPVEKEAYRGAYRLEDLARIYAAVGERDRAVEILTRLMAMPVDLAGPALVIDPAWAPLRGHPGFDRLLAGHP